LKAECVREVEAAVDAYASAARPHTDAMFVNLFQNSPMSLREQREQARHSSPHG
jgi:TPP-dependent pyruvate/acetoin dehydrogenase alpha subunit